jgi:hypothetical protein
VVVDRHKFGVLVSPKTERGIEDFEEHSPVLFLCSLFINNNLLGMSDLPLLRAWIMTRSLVIV